MKKETSEQDVMAMGYGVIPKLVMKDRDLSPEAKSIYAYIASYAGKGDTAFPSVELICYDMNMGKDRFQKHKKQLLKKGYIVIEQGMANGKFKNKRYVISRSLSKQAEIEEEATEEQSPLPDFTAEGGQSVSNLAEENQAYNNNSLNNNNPKDLLDDEDDLSLNLIKRAEGKDFKYWQEKWITHFGTQPPFTKQIHAGLQHWANLFGSEEAVGYAFVRAGRHGGRSYAYLDAILRNWRDEGLRTIEEVYDQELAERH